MGLTLSSTGSALNIKSKKASSADFPIIALAGNPNVGKSTLFNKMTGLNQHTGNWSGKTVESAVGECKINGNKLMLVDIPGTHSLSANSPEEEVARDFICFGSRGIPPDLTLVVCDATRLENNLNLVFEVIEISEKTIVCINFMDEAKHNGIFVDTDIISEKLGVPVVGITARKKNSLHILYSVIDNCLHNKNNSTVPCRVKYPYYIEQALNRIEPHIKRILTEKKSIDDAFLSPQKIRWISVRILENDKKIISAFQNVFDIDLSKDTLLSSLLDSIKKEMTDSGHNENDICYDIISSINYESASVFEKAVKYARTEERGYRPADRAADKILTGKMIGYPIMVLLLFFIFWLTIVGANYPSELLLKAFKFIETKFEYLLSVLQCPQLIADGLIDGVYRVLSWVVSVMLPPMAIFFPLFTLLEDSGYLPRIAYNLDRPFCKCHSCGKQALTSCMGLGCNAAGVVGCRIIDSPRERLIAILTNSFMPCNGRFPAIITLMTVFVIGSSAVKGSSAFVALILTGIILSSLVITFLCSSFLSKTLLKGERSTFILEMPPYRRPQICKVIVRSIFDRTLFVLGRSVAVAAPAGLVIWILANINVGEASVLAFIADIIDPIGKALGLDGTILIAFILGLPANEIVLPIALMTYISASTLPEGISSEAIHTILLQNGWTIKTAICFVVFSVFHWPCSTTLITIKKETNSIKWTLLSAILPTFFGIILCLFINLISMLI